MKKDFSSIYRFISFEYFVNIVQTQKLTFVKPELWEDPYEGFVFKALKSKEGKLQIESIAKSLNPKIQIPIMMINHFSDLFHGQSWSKHEETDALWRIYSYNNRAVRIEIDNDSISRLENVICDEVVYKDFSSLKEEIEDLFDDEGKKISFVKILLRKRKAFEHEGEVRLLTQPNFDFLPDNKTDGQRILMNKALSAARDNGMITMGMFNTGMKDNNKNTETPKVIPKVISIDFSHIKKFIKSVFLHPSSPEWYVNTVKDYCKKNKVRFIGKSKLYTFEV